MEEFLKQLTGKTVDISCGTNSTVRGDVVDVKTAFFICATKTSARLTLPSKK